jgi:hypothetical protein
MSALTIMLIRHAEKPKAKQGKPQLGPGLTEKGVVDTRSLVVRGWQRAGAWAALFGTGGLGADYPKPGAVYAANPDAPPSDDDSISKRPYQAILPLSQRLKLTPVTKYGVGDEARMLNEVRQLTGVVLIAWEHKKIEKVIVPALGQKLKWDGARFDVVLRFDRPQSAAQWTFRQLFPRLLAGDSNVPL